MRRKAFGIPCLITAAALSLSAHAATLNVNSNGGPSGSSGSDEFGVNEVDRLFNNVDRPLDQPTLDSINGNSESGLKTNSDSGAQNGNSDLGLFGPNGLRLGLFSLNPVNTSTTTIFDQIFTNGTVAGPSLAQNPTGQSGSISTELSNAIVSGSFGLSVGSTSDIARPNNVITAFVGDHPLGTGSGFIGDSTAPVVSATPLPAALPLFATGLGGLALLGWLRRRKTYSLKN